MKKNRNFLKPIVASISMIALSLSANATNVYDDIIVPSPNHTVLEDAIVAANLENTLRTTNGITVFAPTDAAFTTLLGEMNITATQLLNNPDLNQILLYHVLTSEVLSNDLVNGTFANTFNGDSVFVSLYGSDVFIDQAQVTAPNLPADNGVVHVIDDVLLEQNSIIDVAVTNGFTILTQAVIAAELVPALIDPMSDLTVFAPTDAAFTTLLAEMNVTAAQLLADPELADILLYHVLSTEVLSTDLTNGTFATTLNGDSSFVSLLSTGVFIDQAKVSLANVDADNGVVHVIDDVILPQNSIIDVAVTNNFSILTQAVIAAELVPALIDPMSDLTVFAPTDAAFTTLLGEMNITAAQLLADPTLSDILLYHVLSSEVLSTDLMNGTFATTLNGDSAFVSLLSTGVYIDQAQVTLADVDADNGVVHVLNDVILPQNSIVDVAITNGFTILTQAVVTAELAPALLDPMSELTVFAPTDAAFSALLTDWNISAAELLANPSLQSILLYHVIGEELLSTDLMNGNVITLNTESVSVSTDNGVMINDSEVTLADVLADNGVVHVIDAVLLPISLGIESEKAITLSIYPNPATNYININLYDAEVNTYNIYDVQGKVINSNNIINNTFTIDLTQFEEGTYFVEFSGKSYKTTKQFIIQK